MQDMVQIRDFLVLHYKVTNRSDSPFWRHCAAMPIPDTLAQKIELFRENGRVFRKNEELFAANSWVQAMLGEGMEDRKSGVAGQSVAVRYNAGGSGNHKKKTNYKHEECNNT